MYEAIRENLQIQGNCDVSKTEIKYKVNRGYGNEDWDSHYWLLTPLLIRLFVVCFCYVEILQRIAQTWFQPISFLLFLCAKGCCTQMQPLAAPGTGFSHPGADVTFLFAGSTSIKVEHVSQRHKHTHTLTSYKYCRRKDSACSSA